MIDKLMKLNPKIVELEHEGNILYIRNKIWVEKDINHIGTREGSLTC